MKAIVFHGVGDIRLDNVPEPKIENETDAIIRITTSAICGTDLHMVRGTLSDMAPGTILGHEGVGIVEELGRDVRNFKKGDRVVIPASICCGNCAYCRSGYTSQCDRANPNGPTAGTAFYGGPKLSGPFNGMQAEYVRVPMAGANLVKLPEEISDEQAIMLSDIFPTGYFGADMAHIHPGKTVAVFGCGSVGQFAIASLRLLGASRIFAIDNIPNRLEMARQQGAEIIDFNRENPIETLSRFTEGIGVDAVIDAVGVDANQPAKSHKKEFKEERKTVAPKTNPTDGNWEPGNAPSQVLQWSVQALAKAGTLSIIGVYSDNSQNFQIGAAMEKNLTIKMGNCNHRSYIPHLINLVRSGAINPAEILTHQSPLVSAIDAFKQFDKRSPGWIKVELKPGEENVENDSERETEELTSIRG